MVPRLVELARHLSERWDELPVATRRRIITVMVERVEVSKAQGRGRIEPERVKLGWRG